MQMTCKTIAVTCCNRAPVYCEAPRSLELVQLGWAPSSDCLWILHCLHCLHCPHCLHWFWCHTWVFLWPCLKRPPRSSRRWASAWRRHRGIRRPTFPFFPSSSWPSEMPWLAWCQSQSQVAKLSPQFAAKDHSMTRIVQKEKERPLTMHADSNEHMPRTLRTTALSVFAFPKCSLVVDLSPAESKWETRLDIS